MFNWEEWEETIERLDDMLFNEDEYDHEYEDPTAETLREIKGVLEDDTRDIRFIEFKMLGNSLAILYFVKCSNLALRSLIHWKLDKLMKQTAKIKVTFYEVGNPNYQISLTNFQKIRI